MTLTPTHTTWHVYVARYLSEPYGYVGIGVVEDSLILRCAGVAMERHHIDIVRRTGHHIQRVLHQIP